MVRTVMHDSSFPRLRGDEPRWTVYRAMSSAFSPPTRG